MKRAILGLLAAVSIASAHAADFAPPSTPAQTVFSWTGVYIGANAGYGSAAGTSTITVLDGPFAGLTSTSSGSDVKGPLAGGQTGFNWQTGALVLGAEGDYQWSNLNRTSVLGCGFACSVNEKITLTSFGTIRARVGVAVDRVLLYATAGGAWMTLDDQASLTVGAVTGQLGKISTSGFGWTAGGGIEAALDPHWSIKGEYLYLSTSNLTGTAPILVLGTTRLGINAHANIGRLGINYRF